MNTCPARVWDNGDMTDCGAPIAAHGLCAFHLADKRGELIAAIGRLSRDLARLTAELHALLADVTELPSFHDRFKR